MKLFVDDIRNAPDDTWTVARTVTDAIRVIARFGDEIKHISLDHDISHQIHMGDMSRPFPCGDAFQGVAYFMGQYYRLRYAIPRVTIHSANVIGGQQLVDILKDYDIEAEKAHLTPANRLEMTA